MWALGSQRWGETAIETAPTMPPSPPLSAGPKGVPKERLEVRLDLDALHHTDHFDILF